MFFTSLHNPWHPRMIGFHYTEEVTENNNL